MDGDAAAVPSSDVDETCCGLGLSKIDVTCVCCCCCLVLKEVVDEDVGIGVKAITTTTFDVDVLFAIGAVMKVPENQQTINGNAMDHRRIMISIVVY